MTREMSSKSSAKKNKTGARRRTLRGWAARTTPKQRILIVDDHAIVRLGMRQLIAAEPDLSICCEAETGEEALALALNAKPDLAIVDLSLGTMHGLELVRQLHQALPDMPVLVLSMHDEALFAERALRAGARGYMTKKGAIEGLDSRRPARTGGQDLRK